MKPLEGKIAVVAGATRGAGRGIATMLGEAGALVYCTGRSVRGKPASGADRPETIEETAELVTKHGGSGIAVQVDHTDEAQVAALFERVRTEQGRLDILVNDIWGGDDLVEWGQPFWKTDLAKGRIILERAIWTHLVTSRYGAPLMIPHNSGLIVEITDGDFLGWRGTMFYDLAKAGAIRLAYSMAWDLRDTGITALAVTPGYLRSEAMLARFGVSEANWRDYVKEDRHFAESETPWYVGRAVAALAADPKVRQKAGKVFASWTLMREYGFSDADGRQPDWGRHMDECIATIVANGAKTADDRFLLLARSCQLDLDPAKAEEVAKIREMLAAGSASV